MNDIEWEEFIKEIIQKGKKVNLKKLCQEKHVGLNTLYRKVSRLQKTNILLYEQFNSLHPYQPRNIQGINFEQLMRECIITGISQKELEDKYGINKRTIQRRFAKIEQENLTLYNIYQIYVEALKEGKELHDNIINQVVAEYIPQQIQSEEQKLQDRRKQFIESMNKATNKQTRNHYKDEIKRIEQQITIIENNIERKGEEK